VRISRCSTLATLRVAYLDHCKSRVRQQQLCRTTLESYARGLGRLAGLADLRLDRLRCPDVTAWYREISRAMTSANAFLAYTALRVMLSWARAEGLCETNVAAGLRIVHRSEASMPVRPEELARLCVELEVCEAEREAMVVRRSLLGLEAVASFSAPRAFRFLAGTGRRISEGCKVRVDEVDLPNRVVSLRRTKTGPSAVMLNDAMVALVEAQLRELDGRSEYLWPSPANLTRPISRWAVYELFTRLMQAAGLRGRTPHGLRHGVAYAALMSGAGLHLAGKLLGHRNLKTTQKSYSGGVYVTPDMHDAATRVHELHLRTGVQLQPRGGAR
jgi:integrase